MSLFRPCRPLRARAALGLVALLILATVPLANVAAFGLQVSDGPVEAPVPAQRYLLRYKYRPNDLVYYEVKHRSQVTIKGVGLPEVTNNETTARKHFRVISVDDEGAGLLELAIDQVSMRVQFGNNDPVEFDSESTEPPPPQFRQIKESIGKPRARTRLTANGELQKVTLLNRNNAPALGQLAAVPQTDANDPSHNFLVVFPPEPIAVGHEWSERFDVRVRIGKTRTSPVTLLRRFKLKSVEGELAAIDMSTVILTPIRNPEILIQLIQRTPTGTAVFDLERGLIVSRTTIIDKRQVGGITDKSSMHVVSRHTERLIEPAGPSGHPASAARDSTRN